MECMRLTMFLVYLNAQIQLITTTYLVWHTEKRRQVSNTKKNRNVHRTQLIEKRQHTFSVLCFEWPKQTHRNTPKCSIQQRRTCRSDRHSHIHPLNPYIIGNSFIHSHTHRIHATTSIYRTKWHDEHGHILNLHTHQYQYLFVARCVWVCACVILVHVEK